MTEWPVRVHSLHLHPVKSCAGVAVTEALVIETGLDLDRAWMLVDTQGRFLSQRELPRLALVRPTMKHSEMILRAPGMLALHIALDTVEEPTRATLWGESFAAYDMGALSARWFSDFVGQEVRLVRFDPEQPRSTGPAGAVSGQAAWHDVHAFHVITLQALEALNQRFEQAGHAPVAMERFRPTIVLDAAALPSHDGFDELVFATDEGPVRLKIVEPCTRCAIVDVDPVSGERGDSVLRALATHSEAPRNTGDEITFGSYAVILEGIDCVLRAGMSGTASRRGD